MTDKINQNRIIVISGPTGIGKTALTIDLAQELNTIIISADSRQVFKHMHIGTAKPSKKELSVVPHYLVDYLELHESISAGKWAESASQIISNHYLGSDNIPIISGGTTFYIRALCEGLDQYPDVPIEIMDELNRQHQQNGLVYLQEELKLKDPIYFKQVDIANSRRLIRAISVIRASGKPFSSFQKKTSDSPTYDVLYLLLAREREELYDRINNRVDQMIDAGLVDEARTLYPQRHLQSLQTVGYQELFEYFDGSISLDEAIRLIKRNSRRYAKRQMTWFRNDPKWLTFHPNQKSDILDVVNRFLNR